MTDLELLNKFKDIRYDCCGEVKIPKRFKTSRKWQIGTGASKTCLINRKKKIAIKMDNAEGCDDCQREADSYISAKEYNIQKILLETRFVGTNINGVNIYIQPLCDDIMSALPRNKFEKYTDQTSNINEHIFLSCAMAMYNAPMRSVWLKKAILCYGKKFMKSFEEWTQEFHVNDLHNGNVGFKDGKPVLFDYCGWNNFSNNESSSSDEDCS